MSEEFDTVIVGAGVAGLTAAVTLERAGGRIVVLEARDRIGGRIFTAHPDSNESPVELGAEFVHGKPPELWTRINGWGLRTCSVEGEEWCIEDGSYRKRDDVIDRLTGLLEKASDEQDQPFAELLAESRLDAESRKRVLSYVEGFNACDATRASVLALKRQQEAEDQIEGDSLFRLTDGYDQVPHRLYSSLAEPEMSVRTETIVRAVNWRPGHVEIEAESAAGERLTRLRARKAIVTVPAAVLKAGAIQFRPAPETLRSDIARIETGRVAKVMLRFRRRLWEDRPELKEAGFLHAHDAPFPTWWTQWPSGTPMLTAWAGGPAAQQILAGRDVVATAVDCCARLLSMDVRPSLVASYFHDWSADEFSRGAYTYVGAGQLDAVERLAQPVEDTLYIAGEATDTRGHWGTVHGAIASGLRAAAQALER